MSLETLPLLVLIACAFSWVGLDLLRKLLAGQGSVLATTFLLVAGQLPLFLLWAAVDGRWGIAPAYWPAGLGCIAVNLIANLGYMRSVQLSPMSATLPLLSLTPVFTTLLAIPMLGEWPTWVQAAGIALVVAGAFALNAGEDGVLRGLLQEKGAPWMVAAALAWSLAPPIDKIAMRHASPGLHAFIMVTGILLGLFVVLLAGGRLGELKEAGRGAKHLVLAAAATCGLALFFQLLAIQMIWVGLVETFKRGVGAVMALVLGRLVFGEELTRARMGAVLLMIAGVGLVLM